MVEVSRIRREARITLGRLQGAGKRAAGDIADTVLTSRNHKLPTCCVTQNKALA